MRSFLPLLPAWALGLWAGFTTQELWTPGRGESAASGWVLLGFLVGFSTLYLGAARIGLSIAVPFTGRYSLPTAAPTPGQANLGKTLVRGFALLGLYVVALAGLLDGR